MTPVGHILTGTAIGIVCLPKNFSKQQIVAHCLTFAIIATIPDWALPSWGHEKYYFSHSVYVNLFIIAAITSVSLLIPATRKRITENWSIYIGALTSWLSHLLLDSFYNHGYGVAIFWPISSARLALPIPWLSVFSGSLQQLAIDDIKTLFLEAVTFLPLIVLAVLAHNHTQHCHPTVDIYGGNMLEKSKKSAIIMGSIVSVTSIATHAIIFTAQYSSPEETGIRLIDELTKIGEWGNLLLMGFTLLIAVLVSGIAAACIYLLDETHYGFQGAVRWAIFGVLSSVLKEIWSTLIPPKDSFTSEFFHNLMNIMTFVISYGLIFTLSSLICKTRSLKKHNPDKKER